MRRSAIPKAKRIEDGITTPLVLYLVSAVVTTSLVRRVLAVLLELFRADYAARLALLPILGFAALLLVDRAVAVERNGEVLEDQFN